MEPPSNPLRETLQKADSSGKSVSKVINDATVIRRNANVNGAQYRSRTE
jgi:hypothetical protein